MQEFTGFPAKMQFTPVPNLFFSRLLPQINDMAELKTTLHILETLYHKRSYPRFVTYGELLANKSLMISLSQIAKPVGELLRDALTMASKRGTILHVALDKDGADEEIYFLNTEADKQAMAKIKSGGGLHLPGLKAEKQAYIETEEPPDIYTLYEQNIGMLTPMIAEELREAGNLYPEIWIEDAIREAVNQNKRKWRYIAAILERWATEGRGDGAYQRDFKKTDPNKYIKGKYGHMVRR